MILQAQAHLLQNPRRLLLNPPPPPRSQLTSTFFNLKNPPLRLPSLSFSARRRCRLLPGCIAAVSGEEISDDEDRENFGGDESFGGDEVEDDGGVVLLAENVENQSMWNQMKEIAMFTGPAAGLWICGPLMSLIDTAVIGQGSSLELAALGPGTVLCDNLSYVFMFLSIATSNMVATALARRDKNEVQHHISILLFVGLACGFLMFFFTRFFGSWALTAFTGAKNLHIVPAANTYVQIRGLAWPAVLIGWVSQSASLGMKDSWGPLKALAVASVINGVGDIILCRFLGYGIAGAAWATMVSQVVAGYMMIENLNKKGYNAYAISIPSPKELMTILGLAAPVFVTMMAKVAFYTLLVYFSTSMGTLTMAAHQVMIQTFCMCTVWGEPLSQTAQSFMPELIYGVKRNLEKARMLLKSLVIVGIVLGLVLGIVGTSVPWLFPNIFTPDQMVIQEMHKVLIPYFFALAVTPPTHSLEGTLLAGRDLKFISMTMSGCFTLGAILLMLISSKGFGLTGCWYALVGFQWSHTPVLQFRNPKLNNPTSTFFNLKNPNPVLPFSFAWNSCTTRTLRLRSSASQRRCRFVTGCVVGEESTNDDNDDDDRSEESERLWSQIKEIVMFSGPATGIWVCAPLMRVIDTAVIGHGSSLELAALGPGTVLCDNLSNLFLFLSIATSNMVATAYARRDKNEVQHHISILLFLGLTCGSLMLLVTRFFGSWALTAFTGANNLHIVPLANTYIQIRGLAWPAVLIVWVAQSASLGMKDSRGPLKALAVATIVNGIGDILLCRVLGYGIAGAAWAAMVSQVVAGYMMLQNLKNKGYNAFTISIPSPKEFFDILGLAGPVFITIMAKVSFYILLVYFAASMGTYTMAAHQVMIQTFLTCTVWGEPLSQTAQSFMPEFLYGVERNLQKARMLLKSLVTMGIILGLGLGVIGTSIPWLFPNIFTHDPMVIQEMHKVLIPYFFALAVTPTTHSFQGTLLAVREEKFLGLSMSSCFILGAILLTYFSSQGFGLPVCWYGLCGFQWARFFLGLQRLLSPSGILCSQDLSRHKVEKLEAV